MNSVVTRFILLSFIFCNIYAAGNQHSKEMVVPGVIIIKFRESLALAKSTESGLEKIWQKYAIQQFEPVLGNTRNLMKQGGSSALNSVYYAYYNSHASPFVVAEELKKSSTGIIYAEPKYLHFISESLVEPPDDSLYQQQYSLRKINAAEAWDITRGEQGEIVIAIVDGGTEINHPDLNANLWVNPGEIPGDSIDNDSNGFIDDIHGWNFPNNNNDPTGLPTTPINANHGTHTAGIASAVTDNSIGISGVSFNAKIMAVNSGSLVSDNIAYGYEGILYAARSGADIISCSWGRPGVPTQFEQDVIDEATARGAVVVAAAGNNDSDGNFFPAHYNNVFSVAAVDSNDVKASFSNYGPEIDVSAPGVSILSTLTSERYGSMSGTSMSCPLAAGVIALVKTKNNSWSGVQAAEQVRVTSDNIDFNNPAYLDDLGAGRINALTALTTELPSIRIIDIQYMDDAGDGIIEPGDLVNIDIQVMNYLKPANNIMFELVENDQFVEILAGNAQLDRLETLQSVSLPTSLKLQVHPDAPTGYVVRLKLKITSAGYQDADYFSLVVLPTFASVDVNNIAVTVTNIGRIGFADIKLTDTGMGFTYKGGPNLLYEGAIIVGISSSQISNAARGVNPISSDQDFKVTQDGNLEVRTPGSVSAQESIGKFADIYASSPLPIQVQQTTFASDDPDKDDFVIFKYRIVNTGNVPLKDFYFGLFFDWDLDGGNFDTNKTGYDHTRNLGYVYDTGNGPATYAGVSVVSDQNVNFRAIFNDESAPENPSWGIYYEFTDNEKWEAISSGVTYTEAGPEDISFTISAGPIIIDPGAVAVIGFAMIAADTLADLQVHADSAKVFWSHLLPLGMEEDEFEVRNPYVYALNQNYPNPFNPVTRILFSIPKSEEVKLSIFNTLGERVETLVSKNLSAGQYEIRWNAAGYASGVYFYQLRAGDFVQRRKMLLLQ